MALLDIGILASEGLRRFPQRILTAIDTAERRTVETLKAVAGKRLSVLLRTDVRVRTGHLRQSAAASLAQAKPVKSADGWSVALGYGSGDSARYARIIEEGGTIRPVNAKVLAVPIGDALTATGRARFASPRDVPGGFWITPRSGPPLFLAPGGKGKGKDGGALFVGLPSVTIRGRHAAERARAEAQGQAQGVFQRELDAALSKAAS